MKKIVLIVIFLGLSYFLYKNIFSKENSGQVTINGNDMVIERGDNKFIAEIISDYKENLRIYGINDNNEQGWSPLAYAAYIFVAAPFAGNTNNCERDNAASAPLLNIIVNDKDIKDKIEKLKKTEGRRSAAIVGKKVRINKFIYKNEDHSADLEQQGKLDPRNAIVINNIEETTRPDTEK